MPARVAVIGGGYGGITVAKALDDVADVTLVEPRDTFVHNVAALRAVTDPAWARRMHLPYDRLLRRGRIVRDRATHVAADAVVLASGTRLTPDFVVLASGSSYPFPAKTDTDDRGGSVRRYQQAHRVLAASRRVLLLGAGPVGLELAGEIRAAWADTEVTIVAGSDDVLPGSYPEEFRTELRRQLDSMGVRLLLGSTLRELPSTAPGEPGTFTVTSHSGEQITADLWFRCFGTSPVTDYLAGDLAAARQPDGRITVGPDLRLPGQDRVFAIGDVTALAETKLAGAAMEHAEVVAANIRALLNGGEPAATYQAVDPSGLVLPLGPKGGATYAPGWADRLDPDTVEELWARGAASGGDHLRHDILDAEATVQFKSAELMVGWFSEILGVDPPA